MGAIAGVDKFLSADLNINKGLSSLRWLDKPLISRISSYSEKGHLKVNHTNKGLSSQLWWLDIDKPLTLIIVVL